MGGKDIDRRKLLRLSSVAAFASLAGCSGQQNSEETSSAGQIDIDTSTPTDTPEPTESGAPAGADQLGGPNDLRASASVEATTLSSDEGSGQYVNTPAVVWVEQAATVTWTIGEGSHSITAYHPDDDHVLGIPEDADPFDSETLESGRTFEQTFETPAVYDRWCRPHEGLGMVGLVAVREAQDGPGTTAPNEVEEEATTEKLQRLLDVAGIGTSANETPSGYAWSDATWDSYWYSLYNMSTNIAMSGNGALFPHNEQQQEAFNNRVPAMLELVSGFRPGDGTVVDDTSCPNHHAAMLWFLSDLTSLTQNGWFGYVNPEPLIPKEKIQQLTDGMAKTTMNLFAPGDIGEMGSTRGLGQMLGAVEWYGTHAGSDDLRAAAAEHANGLAAELEGNVFPSGKVEDGTENQAAT